MTEFRGAVVVSCLQAMRNIFRLLGMGLSKSLVAKDPGFSHGHDLASASRDLPWTSAPGGTGDEFDWLPRLTPDLIAPFHASQNALRRPVNRWVVVIFTIVFDLFWLAQFQSAPEILTLSGVLRFAVFSPCVLAFVCLDRFDKLRNLYDPALLALAIAPTAITAVLFVETTSLASVADARATPLILLTTGLIWRMPPACVFVNAAVSMGAFIVGILWDAGIPRAELGSMILTDAAIGLAVCVFGIQLDARDRRVFISTAAERMLRRELSLRNAGLLRQAQTDGLTGVPNRRCFDEELAARWRDGPRRGQSLSLIMIDIDHFKLFNDHYGHQGGDDCLRKVAAEIQRLSRQGDMVARYGGEEFAVLLWDESPGVAASIAERIRAGVAALALPHAGLGAGAIVTISLGVATMKPTGSQEANRLVQQADRRLYQAKRDGRNRVDGGVGAAPVDWNLGTSMEGAAVGSRARGAQGRSVHD